MKTVITPFSIAFFDMHVSISGTHKKGARGAGELGGYLNPHLSLGTHW